MQRAGSIWNVGHGKLIVLAGHSMREQHRTICEARFARTADGRSSKAELAAPCSLDHIYFGCWFVLRELAQFEATW